MGRLIVVGTRFDPCRNSLIRSVRPTYFARPGLPTKTQSGLQVDGSSCYDPPMQVALVRRKIDPLGGGAERYAARLGRWLASGGHEVTLICQQIDDTLRKEDLQIVQLPRVRTPQWTKATAFAAQAETAVAAKPYDFVFGLSAIPCSDLVRVSEGIHRHYLQERYGSSLLGSLQNINPRHRALGQLEDEVFRLPSRRRFIVQCQLDRFLLHHHFDVADERITVLANGVDTDLFRPVSNSHLKAKQPGPIRLLFAAASNFRRKGLRELIQAIAILRDHEAQLHIAGPINRAYQRLAREWRVDDRVQFLGLRHDMQALYAVSDLVIAPSIYEPFPNVVLESLACGTPVVTTVSNGAAEAIQHGHNGFLIGESQPRAIAEGIEEFLGLSEEERVLMRERSRAGALERSWQSHFARLERVIQRNAKEETANER